MNEHVLVDLFNFVAIFLSRLYLKKPELTRAASECFTRDLYVGKYFFFTVFVHFACLFTFLVLCSESSQLNKRCPTKTHKHSTLSLPPSCSFCFGNFRITSTFEKNMTS